MTRTPFVPLAMLALAWLVPGAGNAEPADQIPHSVENSVVKIFSTMRLPDMARPWSKNNPVEASGSGVVIEGKRILTNAHVVNYASQVQVQGHESGDKISATVVAFAPAIDLALLKLDDESFFNKRPPLARANTIPQVKDAVLAYGYPTGGTSLSVTRGIVSRIEFVPYSYDMSGLRVQIDAAINPGNSGGPAVADGKMIGLAFSHLRNAENIGYIIPNEEIELFLKGVAGGHYDGKPGMYDDLQTLENPALRGFLKLDNSVRGMVVHHIHDPVASYPLKEWDVISRIGDTPIDDQGMIEAGPNLRLRFSYLIQKVARDGTVPLTIVRDGRTQHIQLPVPRRPRLLIEGLQGTYPSYFVYGPLVLARATLESVQLARPRANAAGMVLGSPLFSRLGEPPDADRDELVIVPAPLFPHALSTGYGDPTGAILRSINGIQVRSLAHAVVVLRDLKGEFVTFEFENRLAEGLVFPRAKMLAATEEILSDNGVRAQGSADMLKIWQAK